MRSKDADFDKRLNIRDVPFRVEVVYFARRSLTAFKVLIA
jgi:hypothetical protein